MDYKKFGLCALILSAVIAVSCFVLGFIKTEAPLTHNTPATFYVYNHSTTATEVNADNDSEKFDKINKALNEMTNLNVFVRLAQSGKLNELPSQDTQMEIGYFSSQLQHENLCLEVVFDEIQRQIVQIDGNTKVLEYYSMQFVLEPKGTHVVAVYLNHNTGNRQYSGLPMLVRANTQALYNACAK